MMSAAVQKDIARQEQHALSTLREYLRVPGFSDTGEGIRESAEATLALLRRVDPEASLVETAGNPVVFGRVRSRRPSARTLIVYGLYDETPLVPEEWTVDPMAAAIVDASRLGLDHRIGPVLCGRAAHNHRGPVLALILAVESMLRVERDVPANLLFVIEGEEEVGSPSLAGFVERHRAELAQAEGAWLPCMQEGYGGGAARGPMVVRRAYKGAIWCELVCAGGEWGGTIDGHHIWAGNSPWVDAPLMRLLHAVGSLYDTDHRVTIDGIGDLRFGGVGEGTDDEAVEAIRRRFREDPTLEEAIKRSLGVARLRGGHSVAELLDRWMLDVTVNVQGLVGGYMGPTYYTMLPGRARAKLDFRFPPGITVEEFLGLLRAHLDVRDFHEVEIANVRGYGGAPPVADDSLLQAAVRAAAAHGVETDVWPISNNCCPASLVAPLGQGMPFSVAGLGYGANAHAPNECIRVDAVRRLMEFSHTYLHEWAEVPAAAVTSREALDR